jgi:hypothetical protein
MNTLAVELHPLAHSISYTEKSIVVGLVDGRTVSAPLAWFLRLSQATEKQLNNWELLGDGEGIHWLEIDEDLSVLGLLTGTHYREHRD